MKNAQKGYLLLCITLTFLALGACKKDSEVTPDTLAGVWIGEKVQYVKYADNGTDIIQDMTISLQAPNYAKTVFNSDGSFSAVVQIEDPLEVNEHREGTYVLNGATLTLHIEGEDDMTAPVTIRGNTLEYTLGTSGEATLTYTFRRE